MCSSQYDEDDAEEELEVWLDDVVMRSLDPCNTSWNHAALPELCRLLWRTVSWPLLECAVDAAAALVAQASGSPSLGREGRAERLAMLRTTSLVPALVDVLSRRDGPGCQARHGCYRGSLTALSTLIGSAAATTAAELGRLLPLRSHGDLLPMAAGCLRGLCAHKEARAALLAAAGTARLLRRCLRGGPETQSHALAASCMLRLHELSSSPLDGPLVLRAAEDSQALWRLLLSPLGPEHFGSYWEQRPLPLLLPAGSDGAARLGLFAELLCSLHRVGRSAELPHLPQLPPPPPTAMRDAASHAAWLIESMVDGGGLAVLSGAGQLGGDVDLVRSPDAVQAERVTRVAQRHLPTAAQAARAGYTRIVGCMQWRCAATARLVGALQRAMGAPLNANLYETPAGERGLEAHYDDHCVLVLQLSGSKTWRLSGPAPAEWLPPLRSPRTAAPPASNRETDVMLMRGDALYVPRGVVHSCVAGPEGSTHLTLGVEVEPVLEWHALLQLLLSLTASRAASTSAAAAPARAAACLQRSVSLPGAALAEETRPARERKRRFEKPPAAVAATPPRVRWLELVQMVLLLGRDGEPELRALAPLPNDIDTAAVMRHARCLLLRVAGRARACDAWRLLGRREGEGEAEGRRRLAPLLASFEAAGMASAGGGAADADFVDEAQAVDVAAPSDTAVLEVMELLVESLDGAWVDAACLLQRRMLQQLLEARAVAAEAFLTASGDLHHKWQGRE